VSVDVAVVGAGPAGLAAASAAARAGASVTLIDAGPRPGGQFWRHRARGISADADLHHDLATFARLLSSSGGITYLPGHQVWSLSDTSVHALAPDGSERVIASRYLILAPGAYDRQIPFPGWDLPGVMTAGGAQALLKGQGVVAGRRVLVAGTGPFLLPVAAGLALRGATVVGVHEAHHPVGWLRHPAGVLGAVGKLPEAAGYLRILRQHRVPMRYRSTVVAAIGDDHVTEALLSDGSRVPVDVIAVGWGFTPQLELPLAAGCSTRVDDDGSLVVEVDADQFTSNPRVLVAGEATGIGGAALAVIEGTIAGTAAARASARSAGPPSASGPSASGPSASGPSAGTPPAVGPPSRELAALYRRRARLRGFARAMQQVYPVPDDWAGRLPDDTLVCRCEDVTAGSLREAVDLGATDARTAKLLSRAGMGWCQGRVCGYAVSCLTARWTGTPYDPSGLAERPIASPITLGTLAKDEVRS
jgi:NADPH-dependent 2,4-dienoyl-CoA reductase/sulfur reductase-like enzyme